MTELSLIPIEVRCRPPRVNSAELSKVITSFIRQTHRIIRPGDILSLANASELIASTVEFLRVCDVYCPPQGIITSEAKYTFVMYTLQSPQIYEGLSDYEDMGIHSDMNGDGGGELLPSCTVLPLPNPSLEGLWESLFYGETLSDSAHLKRGLLQYMRAAMIFSISGVNPHTVAWNRLLLFHGPPGTGKTSLCKALSHKLAIRLADVFPSAVLVEINAHSLFSRWFSESGKQVMLLFKRIHELAEKPDCLLCILVDEVESLAAARQSAMKGNEPSDAIRVVNALLTQLDSLQRRHNVVVLATSNITGAIDVAFIDRADKKIFIGMPGLQARIALLKSSTEEMIEKGLIFSLISSNEEMSNEVKYLSMSSHNGILNQKQIQQLEVIARECETLSGRTLKKLPFLAYSESANGTTNSTSSHAISFAAYIHGLEKAVREEISAKKNMAS
ncbi:putative ATPase protein [Trypanosoma theileri]|uniref:Putative ATPase protein n=1 Tax=Trypanosoma theileri TaxID=67003 RepID=A0A1X0NSD8_9TRYP|nr:putative ATPase protein [Trypanosoma theileri]ORC87099.1 putative ATPase protein [Trypanosoma theileri]